MPNLAISVWGDADTEEILRDIVLCREYNIGAISCTAASLPVLGNLSQTARVYALIDNPKKIESISGRENVSVQLFMNPEKIEKSPYVGSVHLILALKLSEIQHQDWNRVFSSYQKTGAKGFLFIDEGGKYINRFYGFLNSAPARELEIQYCAGTNDISIIESAYRLIKKIRPEFLPKFRLFVTRVFFGNLDNHKVSV